MEGKKVLDKNRGDVINCQINYYVEFQKERRKIW